MPKYNRSDAELDQLYEATFLHADNGKGCNEACQAGVSHSVSLTSRPPDQDDPIAHYGLIPSAGSTSGGRDGMRPARSQGRGLVL